MVNGKGWAVKRLIMKCSVLLFNFGYSNFMDIIEILTRNFICICPLLSFLMSFSGNLLCGFYTVWMCISFFSILCTPVRWKWTWDTWRYRWHSTMFPVPVDLHFSPLYKFSIHDLHRCFQTYTRVKCTRFKHGFSCSSAVLLLRLNACLFL